MLILHPHHVEEFSQLAGLKPSTWTPESLCEKVADIFHIQITEVALLELRGQLLHFIFPPELKAAGAIPVSSSAVAARTAQEQKAEIFNHFTQVNHFSVFELVKMGDSGLDAQIIQKLMSAPIINSQGKVAGVIQISRKAPRLAIAGADFTPADLKKLESVAHSLAKLWSKGRVAAHSAAQI